MSVTIKRLHQQESLIRRLYPALESVSCVVTPLAEAPLDEVARLIGDAWRRAFGDRIRIAYTSPFLRYCAGPAPSRGWAIIAYTDDGPQGVILGLPLDLMYRRQPCPAILTTGLCVSAAWEGRGLVELLMATHGRTMLNTTIQCGLHWRSTKNNQGRDAGKRLAQATAVPLYAKALCARRAAHFAKCSARDRLGLRFLSAAQALGRRLYRLSASYHFAPFTMEHAKAGAAFLAALDHEHELTLNITPEGLAWNCAFSEADIHAAGWVLLQNDDVRAIAWGYRNPVSEADAYFEMDRLAFASTLPQSIRRGFTARVEQAVQARFDCFAILMSACACNEPLENLSYRPVKTYYLGASDMGMQPPLRAEHLAHIPLPLR